ncbi:Hypothetical predicted protein [Olea europaea subsp. europaea]|uniref:Uncharacterized protein n=1 Tax=Olea europaea subsp. europaea TaxID=158383 RepID=A0A8S0VCA2_OLEEU|nr:Hypothetical predicted protein [Olea europaea subsp. europaea]
MNRPRLAARLTRELVVITANVRTTSRQNAAMRKLLELMQGQLVNFSQNEEVIPLERKVDVDMVTDYITGQITEETVVPLECNRANAPRRQPVSSIGLVLQERDRIDPPFRPLKPDTLLSY